MLTREWQKSSRSSNNTGDQQGQCVEARLSDSGCEIRDSKLGEISPILDASLADWRGFITAVSKLPPSTTAALTLRTGPGAARLPARTAPVAR